MWGGNEKAQLGLGHKSIVPVPEFVAIPKERVCGIACASWHSVVVTCMDGGGRSNSSNNESRVLQRSMGNSDSQIVDVCCVSLNN
jgi:hypothetical protein